MKAKEMREVLEDIHDDANIYMKIPVPGLGYTYQSIGKIVFETASFPDEEERNVLTLIPTLGGESKILS